MTTQSDFFHIGGTMDEDAPSYIDRPADRELFEWLEKGELCMVLAPRQTGKSSLMVRARSRLKKIGVRSGIVDFQSLSHHQHQDPEPWFRDVLDMIARNLGLETDAIRWWDAHSRLGPTRRFMNFVEDVILKEINGKTVIFFDEIDSVLSLPFSDDFFTTIRAIRNASATNPELKRITFVLLGVASPSEFIRDKTRTPFNIGRELELADIPQDALSPFREALGNDAVMDRIFDWTSGQPLMTQNLAAAMRGAEASDLTPEAADRIVRNTYVDAKIDRETHLKFIRDYLLADKKHVRQVLNTYGRILKGKPVPYDNRSPVHTRIRLSGIARLENESFMSRNRIYRRVFDETWIRQHKPANRLKIVAGVSAFVSVALLLWFFLLQPFFFKKFEQFQTSDWADIDFYYMENESVTVSLPMPNAAVKKVTVECLPERKEIINISPDMGREDSGGPTGTKRNVIDLPFKLKKGENDFLVKFHGGYRKVNYRSRIQIVCFPETDWRLPSDWTFAEIPPGEFMMGSDFDPEEFAKKYGGGAAWYKGELPRHKVTLTTGFFLQTTEVTQAQWKGVMGNNPSYFQNCGDDCPVEQVSWNDVVEFVRRVTKIDGKHRYRLPTEAEWEYACRAGTSTDTYNGDLEILGQNNAPVLDKIAWYGGNSCVTYSGGWKCSGWEERQFACESCGTHPVGTKIPNSLGLHDMIGNVWEWCNDGYGDYPTQAAFDPKGAALGANRVFRGGGWAGDARVCRSAIRGHDASGYRSADLGFRLARSRGQQ